MPHIQKDKRELLSGITKAIQSNPWPLEKGELEYLVYYLMGDYMKDRAFNYANLHEVVYAVIHSAEEFKRNHLDKREDHAKKQNTEAYYGDERITK